MPVRRSSTSFRQLLRGSSYFSRLPTECSSSKRYRLNALMHESVELSAVWSASHCTARCAQSPMRSSMARYASVSSFGYSMRAMTSAAGASVVPGAFDAASSAATRSLRMAPASGGRQLRVGDEPLEHRQRERLQAVDDELRAGKLVGGITVRHRHAPE